MSGTTALRLTQRDAARIAKLEQLENTVIDRQIELNDACDQVISQIHRIQQIKIDLRQAIAALAEVSA